MARRRKMARCAKPKSVLRFPDLDHSKIAVRNSLPAASSQESDGHAIDEFIGWYCSEPRLAFNRTVVLHHRFFRTEGSRAIDDQRAARGSAPIAYEASDTGLLSPDMAANRGSGRKREAYSYRSGTNVDKGSS